MEDVGSYHFSTNHNTIEEVFRSFLNQFYSQTRFIPSEVIIPVQSADAKLLEEWLRERKGKKVEVVYPQRGDKVRLIEMAQRMQRMPIWCHVFMKWTSQGRYRA